MQIVLKGSIGPHSVQGFFVFVLFIYLESFVYKVCVLCFFTKKVSEIVWLLCLVSKNSGGKIRKEKKVTSMFFFLIKKSYFFCHLNNNMAL